MGKFPGGQISWWANFLVGRFPVDKFPVGKFPVGKFPGGQISGGQISSGQISQWANFLVGTFPPTGRALIFRASSRSEPYFSNFEPRFKKILKIELQAELLKINSSRATGLYKDIVVLNLEFLM